MREVGISGTNINANCNHCATLCCCLAAYGLIIFWGKLPILIHILLYIYNVPSTVMSYITLAKIRTDCTHTVMVVMVRLKGMLKTASFVMYFNLGTHFVKLREKAGNCICHCYWVPCVELSIFDAVRRFW
jgi:hypothetical protein